MDRRLAVVLALSVATLPGCATRNGRAAAFAVGTLATLAGVVWTADAAASTPPCEMPAPGEEDLDPFCIGAVGAAFGKVLPPVLLGSTGVSLMVAAGIQMWLHRNNPYGPGEAPRHRGRDRRENLRSDRWYKLRDDAGRAPRPR